MRAHAPIESGRSRLRGWGSAGARPARRATGERSTGRKDGGVRQADWARPQPAASMAAAQQPWRRPGGLGGRTGRCRPNPRPGGLGRRPRRAWRLPSSLGGDPAGSAAAGRAPTRGLGRRRPDHAAGSGLAAGGLTRGREAGWRPPPPWPYLAVSPRGLTWPGSVVWPCSSRSQRPILGCMTVQTPPWRAPRCRERRLTEIPGTSGNCLSAASGVARGLSHVLPIPSPRLLASG
jgi:hypothetical protein